MTDRPVGGLTTDLYDDPMSSATAADRKSAAVVVADIHRPKTEEAREVDMLPTATREPAWSGALTTPVAALIRPGWRLYALTSIKALHTAIFASIGAALVLVVLDGLRQRPRLRTLVAGGIVLGESAIYASNNQVCPLTPLAEQLGARRGSVADIFLPDWFSSRIPVIGGGMLALGLALNGRAWLRR